jgi:hypothetical protein
MSGRQKRRPIGRIQQGAQTEERPQRFQPEEHVSGLAGLQGIEREAPTDYIPQSLPGHKRATTFEELRVDQEKQKAREARRKEFQRAEMETVERWSRMRHVPSAAEMERIQAEQQAESIRIAQDAKRGEASAAKITRKRRKELAALHIEKIVWVYIATRHC